MATLAYNTYGKTGVRLTFVDRSAEKHEVRELNVEILFEGEFEETYTTGSNTAILPTDTMKNTVYVLARQLRWRDIETFARGLAGHFLSHLSHLNQVTVRIRETPWKRIGEHTAAFVQEGSERRIVEMMATRSKKSFRSGLKNLQVLKTANSGFSGFFKDEFTTLAETSDRLFGTIIEADWGYSRADIDFNDVFAQIRQTLLSAFASHNSLSVQQTLFFMAEAVLAEHPVVQEIHLTMPNKHCLLVDLDRFGIDNPNQVFLPIDEPSGYIEANVTR